MTTNNNDQSLIKKVGGIERARRIVKWQSESSWADHYCISENTIGSAGRKFSEELCLKNNDFVLIDDLRTAIAKHDTTDHVTDIRNHVSPNTRVVDL